MKVIVTTTSSVQDTLEIPSAQLLDLLRAAGLDLPLGTRCYVRVPGGGDWSNTDLECPTLHVVCPAVVSTSAVESERVGQFLLALAEAEREPRPLDENSSLAAHVEWHATGLGALDEDEPSDTH